MRQIFISYSHKDKEIADTLYSYLNERGVRVFIDTWGIGIGERITEVLGDAISGSNYVIILASPEAIRSSWVQAELDTALNFELSGKGKLLVIRIRESSLPALIRGKLFIDLGFNNLDANSLDLIYEAIQPNIYRNGWKCSVFDFAGRGGAAVHNLKEEGFTFYRLDFKVTRKEGFAGTSFEFIRGSVNVANYNYFTFKIRNTFKATGRFKLKFETKEDWPIKYINLDESKWKEVEPIELNLITGADWERLERITVAVDDRDIEIGEKIVVDIADFSFY